MGDPEFAEAEALGDAAERQMGLLAEAEVGSSGDDFCHDVVRRRRPISSPRTISWAGGTVSRSTDAGQGRDAESGRVRADRVRRR